MMRVAILAFFGAIFTTTCAFQLPALSPARGSVRLYSTEEDTASSSSSRLGSSIDQDGKSNIWAVEPKMRVDEVQEGGGQAVAIAVGAVLAFGLIAASFLLINVEQ